MFCGQLYKRLLQLMLNFTEEIHIMADMKPRLCFECFDLLYMKIKLYESLGE